MVTYAEVSPLEGFVLDDDWDLEMKKAPKIGTQNNDATVEVILEMPETTLTRVLDMNDSIKKENKNG